MILDQRGMNSLKWEFTVRNEEPEVWKETDSELGEEYVLSIWVTDMHFRTAEPVIHALIERWNAVFTDMPQKQNDTCTQLRTG